MKIVRYYFSGRFDISPFANMSASLLLEVMGSFRGINRNPLNAVFRLLSSRPDLCTFGGDVREETVEYFKDNGYKRQRINQKNE